MVPRPRADAQAVDRRPVRRLHLHPQVHLHAVGAPGCNGLFAGIAGADILAEQVERAVVPALMRLTGVAVITSSNGRIIASNTARFRPGTVLGRQEAIGDLRPSSEENAQVSLPWTLYESPAA